MFNDQPPPSTSTAAHAGEDNEDVQIRDIHALTSPQPPPVNANRNRRGEANWETTSQRSTSIVSEASSSSENFTSMSREFNALVIAGAEIGDGYRHDRSINEAPNNLSRIGEEEDTTPEVETNPLAIVPDGHPFDDLTTSSAISRTENRDGGAAATREISLHMVKKEEVETKISAWQNAKIAKINNRYKREDAVISGWEREQVQKASSWMKKIERKLEEKRAKALEKMENEVAKAHRKAEERRASAEAKRGTKVAKVIEISNLMRAVGRPPAKRSFF
ncbi:remorin 4.1 [Cucumis sativus]|uniref:Remorin n=1 Tax=Cucumis sativus TaxID=3659 RepID=A0A0A0LBJ6_CUCSA|nr:remorin 4.1 [Cucumis sativus]KGN59395.1 hypothetical protein Csa_001240 [Cucumis sativus]